jgi:Mrp family chromosome partitioning ATPase
VASNLALALAEIGLRVLLIDGDLYKGRLHEVFQVSNSWGLRDMLRGQEPPPGREKIVIETKYRDLYLLPAGSNTLSIPSLLHSPRMLDFLRRTRQEFHTVIIDAPPMMHMADARVLGKLADAVVLRNGVASLLRPIGSKRAHPTWTVSVRSDFLDLRLDL